MQHELKILPKYFNDVYTKVKPFELRKNDRDFQVGDVIYLREYDGENYTGRTLVVFVTYVLKDCIAYGLQDGYCILGIRLIGTDLALCNDGGGK